MDPIFETGVPGTVGGTVHVGDRAFKVSALSDAGHALVAAPVETGEANDWTRDTAAETRRRLHYERLGAQLAAEMAAADAGVESKPESKPEPKGKKK